ncbi:unnamed protein product [Prorocentrum cordatum]|uniref:Uncharacterized protein n=1 Tax=Prorocentrum cordatum TaxID=2364126 RepID=A0ABN9XM04_9DINO|nr:unnamed protein product [Polarella glacialis]
MLALMANGGNVVEAMDQLSTLEFGPGGGASPAPEPSPRTPPPPTTGRPSKGADEGPEGAGVGTDGDACANEQSEEEQLRRILALSQREEEEKNRQREAKWRESLEAALALSMQEPRPLAGAGGGAAREADVENDEDDSGIPREVLEESRRMQEADEQRRERQEQADLEDALRASLMLVRFHDSMDVELESSPFEESAEADDWPTYAEEIRQAYEEPSRGAVARPLRRAALPGGRGGPARAARRPRERRGVQPRGAPCGVCRALHRRRDQGLLEGRLLRAGAPGAEAA